jgi:hypothetical protein
MTARHWFAVYHAPMGIDDEPRLRAMDAGAKAALIAAILLAASAR